jgi:hypothetical protein
VAAVRRIAIAAGPACGRLSKSRTTIQEVHRHTKFTCGSDALDLRTRFGLVDEVLSGRKNNRRAQGLSRTAHLHHGFAGGARRGFA